MLLTQYKLSYTREFRIQVTEIQAAIDHVYKLRFHKKQFFLTGTFSFVYVLCLFAGFYLIIMSVPTEEPMKDSTGDKGEN